MIGIADIGVFIPEVRLSNRDRMEEFGLSESFLETKIGVERVARMAPGMDTLDLCLGAVAALDPGGDADWLAGVQVCVVCTQNGQGQGLPHTSALVQGALGLPANTVCFDISLGCSGFVQGLSILTALMQVQGLDRALFITADPYSKIIDPSNRDTCLLFGDGAAATVLQRCSAKDGLLVPGGVRVETAGSRGGALSVRDSRLHMDGRAVFNFAAESAPREIRALLDAEGLALEDVDRFALHQGSRYIVEAIRKRLGVSEAATPLGLWDHGNLVSSSIPVLLKPMISNPDVATVAVCGFGVGLNIATGLLRRSGWG